MVPVTIDIYKKADKKLVRELGIRHFSRHVGYDDIGNPVELVYNVTEHNYEWHIGGEFKKQASDNAAAQFLQRQ